MTISKEDLIDLINNNEEDENLEFKEARDSFPNDTLCKYYIGIANEGGGKLILGVKDKTKEIVGSNAFLNLGEIRSFLHNTIKMRIEAQEITIEEKRVVVFEIPSRPRGIPLSFKGRYLMRVGEELLSMTHEQMQKIFDEVKKDILLEKATSLLQGGDVIELLDTQSFFELFELPYPNNQNSVLEKLKSEELIVEKGNGFIITKLGALLFAKDLTLFDEVKYKGVRVITYKGNTKFETIRDLQGKKGYATSFENLIAYISSQIPANEVIEKDLRKTVNVYPDIAIRELVANAIIHQDFSISGTRVTIGIYDDRIEIENPGQPIIDEKRFIDGYRSRNGTLTDIMRRIGVCEEQGSGVDKVIFNVEAYQLPAPDFRVSETHTTAVLFTPIPFDKISKSDKIRATYQHCCLKCVSNEKMSNESLRSRFDIDNRQAYITSRIIKDTLKNNLIKLEAPESKSKRYSQYIPYWA